MRELTVADLRPPPEPLPPALVGETLRKMFGMLDATLADPRYSEPQRLYLLQRSVLPLASILVCGGTPPSVAVQHAAELLESQYLHRVLTERPGLAVLFSD